MDNNNLIEEMRKMIRQELGNFRNQLNQQKPIQQQSKPVQNTQKPNLSGAVSIRDEIRKIVREELQAMKNNDSRKTQVVQQQKPIQKLQNNQSSQKQQIQNKPQANVLRITSVQQLTSHLQDAINKQLQQRQIQVSNKPVIQKQEVKKIVVPNNQQNKSIQKNNFQVKITPNAISNKPVQKQQPQNANQQFVKKVPNVPSPEQQKILANQANNLLSRIGKPADKKK